MDGSFKQTKPSKAGRSGFETLNRGIVDFSVSGAKRGFRNRIISVGILKGFRKEEEWLRNAAILDVSRIGHSDKLSKPDSIHGRNILTRLYCRVTLPCRMITGASIHPDSEYQSRGAGSVKVVGVFP